MVSIPHMTFWAPYQERRETCVMGDIRHAPAVGEIQLTGRCPTSPIRQSGEVGPSKNDRRPCRPMARGGGRR